METADGNVVVAGYTAGNWNNTNDGNYDIAAAKLNVDDGEVIWKYQVRQSSYPLRLRDIYLNRYNSPACLHSHCCL